MHAQALLEAGSIAPQVADAEVSPAWGERVNTPVADRVRDARLRCETTGISAA